MDYSKGFSSTCYAAVVDPATWRDIGRIELTGGTVKRSTAELAESADIDCVAYDQTAERWIRIYMDTRQAGEGEHVALFTGLATSPDKDISGRLVTNSVQCYSVLKPAQDILLPLGWYAPAGYNGAELARTLLQVTPAPVEIEGISPALSNTIIAEEKETNLSMALAVLEAIIWRLRSTGDGTIQLLPMATEAEVGFDQSDYDCIETELEVSYDWFKCPNVFRAISDDLTAEVRDDDPDSPLSTVSRGREIWAQETNCDLNDNEGIGEYAHRRLKELQRVTESISYDRRLHPDLRVGDLVRIHYPVQRIDGIYRVDSQSIKLEANGKTSEEVSGYE